MTMLKDPLQAALGLTERERNQGYIFETLHEYTNKDGSCWYWRIRLKNPVTQEKWIRPMHYKDGKYFLGEPDFNGNKPLYKLDTLFQNIEETVFICEGEMCVDTIIKLGLTATTSGSASSAEKADWSPLAGRHVIIWPDNDKAGQQYANTVANILRALKCNIQFINLSILNLPDKGDVVNWLNDNMNATKETVMALPTVNPVIPEIVPEVYDEDDSESIKPNQATILVDFVCERTELFHDKNANTYTRDNLTGEIRRLDSRQFKDWLLAYFYDLTNRTLREQSIREALSTLSGLARMKGTCQEVFIRAAQHEDAYYLDLGEIGNSRAIKINYGMWEVVEYPPVCFFRPETMLPLPTPISTENDLSRLWHFVNIPENARLLCITWLIETLRIDTPFPLLELIGEQGSAKSTTQSVLRTLIDPNACNLRGAAKNTEDIFIGAASNWYVSYENISHLTPAMQDVLCILATGGGFAKRKLYSDADESVVVVKRPVILNGISAAVTAQDLIDRTISIEMPIITSRAESTHLWQQFSLVHAELLGALLDTMAKALDRLPSIEIPKKNCPRLIEFARLGMAVAEALGKSNEDFLIEFNVSRQESISRTIDASPVASALIEWFEKCQNKIQKLPVNELLRMLEKPQNTDAWPRSAKGFADALRRAAPALRQLGIDCYSLGKIGSHVLWVVKACE